MNIAARVFCQPVSEGVLFDWSYSSEHPVRVERDALTIACHFLLYLYREHSSNNFNEKRFNKRLNAEVVPRIFKLKKTATQ